MSVPGADGADLFVKISQDSRTGSSLRGEGEMLRVAAHPGVVELIRSEASGEGWELVLRRVPGSDLTRQPPWTADELAGFGAAVATTVADLHDLSVVHGRLAPEHLLVDGSGRPLLCGFGQARRCHGDPAAEDRKAADVADLARCLAARMPAGAPRRLQGALNRAMAGGRRRPVTARQLARVLGQSVAAPVLPMPREATGPDVVDEAEHRSREEAHVSAGANGAVREAGLAGGAQSRRHDAGARPKRASATRAMMAGLLLAVLAGGVLVAVLSPWGIHRAASPASRRAGAGIARSLRCPAVDDRCRPVAHPNGILAQAGHRYRMGEVGDVLVLGRWTCSAVALPALLRPATGQVWAFGRWAAPGRGSTATLLGRVAEARSLRVVPGAHRCDRIEVLRRVGPPVVVGWPDPSTGRARRVVTHRSRP